jgi:hypothetical protein
MVAALQEPAREVVRRIEMRQDDLVKAASLCVDQMFVVHAIESPLVGQRPQWFAPPGSVGSTSPSN